MSSKKVAIASLVGLLLFFNAGAQDSIRSFLGKYLVDVHEIDSAEYQSKKKHGKIETITNYYADSLASIKFREIDFLLYKFGSYTEHTRPHFALLRAGSYNENCIIDCGNITDDLNKILSFLKTYQGSFKETENVKIKVMKRVIKDYPSFY